MSDPARRLALVLGGADGVWNDVLAALELATPDAVFAINDMIPAWPGPVDFAVTLHPDFLPRWLDARAARGLPPPGEVWSHRRAPLVAKVAEDWQGSSGLLAAKIALDEGFAGIVLAGVPMEAAQKHFVRQRPWSSASAFLKGWRFRMALLKPHVRSTSGWTREQLGPPSPEWLAKIKAAPPDPDLIARVRAAMEQTPT